MGLKVGVLGVGPVGEHIVRVLGERKFPVDGQLPFRKAERGTARFLSL